MAKKYSEDLFQLIRSMGKAEKRHFKLYITRSSSRSDLKVIRLFDLIDKMKEYQEEQVLKKIPSIQKGQLPNLKAHLYKEILSSLRLLKTTDSLDLQLHELIDHAHILYKKGLFLQSLKILEKGKELAKSNHKFTFLAQLIALEKRIESLHITRSMQDRAETLSAEAIEISTHIDAVTRLSNLALQLYSWYIRKGHAHNDAEVAELTRFFKSHLPENAWAQTGFYQRLYLAQSYCWYAFIRQDFITYYRHTHTWVELFEQLPLMKRVETGHYIKGLHNLLNAHFDLRNQTRFAATLKRFDSFSKTERVQKNENFRIQTFLYLSQAKINQHFLRGTFCEGLALVPGIESRLSEYELFVDPHRVMVLTYKIAMLYFGSGDFSACIDYLHKIINDKPGLRADVQCYARLMHLLAHYELENYEIMEHLSRSVYRFMEKMDHLTEVEEEILKFLRRSMYISPYEMKTELVKFYNKIKPLEKNCFQSRIIVYLDIFSWLESKIYNKRLSEVVKEKYCRM